MGFLHDVIHDGRRRGGTAPGDVLAGAAPADAFAVADDPFATAEALEPADRAAPAAAGPLPYSFGRAAGHSNPATDAPAAGVEPTALPAAVEEVGRDVTAAAHAAAPPLEASRREALQPPAVGDSAQVAAASDERASGPERPAFPSPPPAPPVADPVETGSDMRGAVAHGAHGHVSKRGGAEGGERRAAGRMQPGPGATPRPPGGQVEGGTPASGAAEERHALPGPAVPEPAVPAAGVRRWDRRVAVEANRAEAGAPIHRDPPAVVVAAGPPGSDRDRASRAPKGGPPAGSRAEPARAPVEAPGAPPPPTDPTAAAHPRVAGAHDGPSGPLPLPPPARVAVTESLDAPHEGVAAGAVAADADRRPSFDSAGGPRTAPSPAAGADRRADADAPPRQPPTPRAAEPANRGDDAPRATREDRVHRPPERTHAPAAPRVHIGQIDVVVLAPPAPPASGGPPPASGTGSLSSRHYLRNL